MVQLICYVVLIRDSSSLTLSGKPEAMLCLRDNPAFVSALLSLYSRSQGIFAWEKDWKDNEGYLFHLLPLPPLILRNLQKQERQEEKRTRVTSLLPPTFSPADTCHRPRKQWRGTHNLNWCSSKWDGHLLCCPTLCANCLRFYLPHCVILKAQSQ